MKTLLAMIKNDFRAVYVDGKNLVFFYPNGSKIVLTFTSNLSAKAAWADNRFFDERERSFSFMATKVTFIDPSIPSSTGEKQS